MSRTGKIEREDGGPNAYRCDDCGSVWRFAELHDIRDLGERLDAGGEVPAGDCPDDDCQALCYPVPADAAPAAPASENSTEAITRALQVLVLDRQTRAYLREHDPKALQQAAKALHDAGRLYLVASLTHDGDDADLCRHCFAVLDPTARVCLDCAREHD